MLPDICLTCGDNESATAIGRPEGVGGGVPDSASLSQTGMASRGSIGGRCKNKPVLSMVSRSARTFVVALQRADGSPVDLTGLTAEFAAKEDNRAITFYIRKPMVVADAADGLLTVDLLPDEVLHGGVWLAAILLSGTPGLLATYDLWLHVEKSILSSDRKNNMVTIPELRLVLMDRCPADNPLLDDVDFSDSDLCSAITLPVYEWNETPPVLEQYTYTPATFPYKYNWLQAAAGEAMRITARRLSRNRLVYTAGGVNVDDLARAQVYAQMGQELRDEWKTWMMREKVRLNAEQIYGGVRSRIYY
jgi:hypothetical protein